VFAGSFPQRARCLTNGSGCYRLQILLSKQSVLPIITSVAQPLIDTLNMRKRVYASRVTPGEPDEI